MRTDSLVSVPADASAPLADADVTANVPASATDVPASKLRAATPADASLLADALAREINRQYRAIVDSADDASDDPYALATRGRDKAQARKRTLGTSLGALKVARDKYNAVYQAWLAACAELTDATTIACSTVNVGIGSIAESLGIAFKSTGTDDPISKLAAERKERERKEREAREAIIAERKAAKLRVLIEREARDAAILAIKLGATEDPDVRAKLQASHDEACAKRRAKLAE